MRLAVKASSFLVLLAVALVCVYFAYGLAAGYIRPFGVVLATPWNFAAALIPLAVFVISARYWRNLNAKPPAAGGR